MLLHFILMLRPSELEARRPEFEYASRMAAFFATWIRDNFGESLDVRCDEMAVRARGVFGRPGIGTLLRDHAERDEAAWHFYLANFRPVWTDSLCEGYHSERMCMVKWHAPPDPSDTRALAEKNCTAVSYELAHELARKARKKSVLDSINDVWSRHHGGDLPFAAYGADHAPADSDPEFLTIDASAIER